MNGMAALQVAHFKRWHRDAFGLQPGQCEIQPAEIPGIHQDHEVRIAAKFRRAVQDARLPAHQEGLHFVLANRRKDFAYRVRDQGNRPILGTTARDGKSPPIARRESSDTTPPTPNPRRSQPRSRSDHTMAARGVNGPEISPVSAPWPGPAAGRAGLRSPRRLQARNGVDYA